MFQGYVGKFLEGNFYLSSSQKFFFVGWFFSKLPSNFGDRSFFTPKTHLLTLNGSEKSHVPLRVWKKEKSSKIPWMGMGNS